MTKHIKNLVDGLRQTLVVAPDAQYTLPTRGATRRDMQALSSDARSVAGDIRKSARASGQQVHKR